LDDYPDTADSLAVLLRTAGHDPRAVRSGAGALALLDGWQPDAAVLDLRMPLPDGFTVAERLARSPRRPLLVAVSGSVLPADWERAAALFDHHFIKPVEPCELLELLWCYQGRREGALV
jgi:CheY-like chemotaxis protein